VLKSNKKRFVSEKLLVDKTKADGIMSQKPAGNTSVPYDFAMRHWEWSVPHYCIRMYFCYSKHFRNWV